MGSVALLPCLGRKAQYGSSALSPTPIVSAYRHQCISDNGAQATYMHVPSTSKGLKVILYLGHKEPYRIEVLLKNGQYLAKIKSLLFWMIFSKQA